MPVPLPRSITRYRQQPQQPAPIDWSNPIARGLVFAYVFGGTGVSGYGEDGRNILNYMNTAGFVTGIPLVTNIGFGAKLGNNSFGIASPAQRSVTSGVYSLFAHGTMTSNTVTQSAIDDDDGTTRRFQFRVSNGAAEFIPFNSAGVAGTATGAVMPLSTLTGGFTMGAVATSSTASVWSNGRKTSINASGILAPNATIWVGNRKASTNAWSTGGISLAMMWNRPLTDAEMQSLASNPWQLFKMSSSLSSLATLAGIMPIPRAALYLDSNGIVKQRPSGMNVKPLVLINGVLQPQTSNQTPVILVNGQLRNLKSNETLIT